MTLQSMVAQQKKTKELRFPWWLKEELQPHFTRGYIDGDGWVRLVETKHNDYLEVGWCGTWAMTFEIGTYLSNHTTYFNPVTYPQGSIYSNRTAGRFAIEICNHIYKDATRKMERKYQAFTNHIPNIKRKHKEEIF